MGYLFWTATVLVWANVSAQAQSTEKMVCLRGEVVDAQSGERLACRLYVVSGDGIWFFAESASPDGTAIRYDKQNRANSVERHSTLSAHPFTVDLPAGQYTITVERGKAYHPETVHIELGGDSFELKVKLRRWIDMARRGWYSGDTHVHRTMDELPNVQIAEDLNVSFPLLYWVRDAFVPPGGSQDPVVTEPKPQITAIDSTHVIYPVNTEYEIFKVEGKAHTLGAFFVLNHKTPFDAGAPPVGSIADRAHREGALLELDKHAWEWSMMLVPVMDIDLYELTNNHIWRTGFAFTEFGIREPAYMKLERNEKGWTEWGWIDYGFQNYYALLNCGYRLRPTAGTASGVHPVPLGFGRVYVHLENGFNYDAWVDGLNRGRSFVTTGPMLFVKMNDEDAGHTFRQTRQGPGLYRVTGSAVSAHPLHRIELLVNGEVVHTVKPDNHKSGLGAFECSIDKELKIDASSWIAVRCFEDRPDGRVRFAHSSPFHVDVIGRPLRPRREEVEFLIERVEDQIARSGGTLPESAMDEYRAALRAYRNIAADAR